MKGENKKKKMDCCQFDSFDKHLMLCFYVCVGWVIFCVCVTVSSQTSDCTVQGVVCVSLFFCLSKLCSVI